MQQVSPQKQGQTSREVIFEIELKKRTEQLNLYRGEDPTAKVKKFSLQHQLTEEQERKVFDVVFEVLGV